MQEKMQKNAKIFAGMPKLLYLCTLFPWKKDKCHEVRMTDSTLVVIV